MLLYNGNLREPSRRLRKDMTDAERAIWAKVRKKQLKGLQFYRQKTIGNFIVDFFCPKAKLVVEIDGSQHYEAAGLEKDAVRDEFLRAQGLKVLRFSNREVLKNMAGVLERVEAEIAQGSLVGEGERAGANPSGVPLCERGRRESPLGPSLPKRDRWVI